MRRNLIRSVVEWAAVLLVAFGATLLLTSAAAYAECAWAVWQEMAPLSGDSVWRLVSAVPTYAACQSELKATRASGRSRAKPTAPSNVLLKGWSKRNTDRTAASPQLQRCGNASPIPSILAVRRRARDAPEREQTE